MRIMAEAERILGRPANVAPNSRPGRYMREVYTHNPEALPARIEDALKAYAGGPVFVLSRFRKHVSKIARTLAAMGIPCTGIRADIGPWGSVRIGRHKDTLERETVNLWQLTRAVRRYAAGGDIAPMPYEEAEALILATLPPARRQSALTDLKAKLRRTPPIRVGDVARWIPLAPRRPADPGPPEPPAGPRGADTGMYLPGGPARDGDRPRSRPSGYHPREQSLEAPAVLLHTDTSPAWLPAWQTRNAWPKNGGSTSSARPVHLMP